MKLLTVRFNGTSGESICQMWAARYREVIYNFSYPIPNQVSEQWLLQQHLSNVCNVTIYIYIFHRWSYSDSSL